MDARLDFHLMRMLLTPLREIDAKRLGTAEREYRSLIGRQRPNLSWLESAIMRYECGFACLHWDELRRGVLIRNLTVLGRLCRFCADVV